MTTTLDKSIGHLCFVEGFEWLVAGGDLYRAPVGNAMDIDTHVRHGRWECTVECARRYAALYPFLPKAFFETDRSFLPKAFFRPAEKVRRLRRSK
jgi:hypothetical protein